MLILSRKLNEEIVIGEKIRITVLRINGNRVRLGFTAPEGIRIDRAEIGENTFVSSRNDGDLAG